MGKTGNWAECHGGVWMLVSYSLGGEVVLATATTLRALERKASRAGWIIDHIEEGA